MEDIKLIKANHRHLHNNTRSQHDDNAMTPSLVDTPFFQLISGFFHVNKVLSVLSMLSKLPPGVCWGGGGGGGGQQAC